MGGTVVLRMEPQEAAKTTAEIPENKKRKE
jgi:hypothetical protein